MKLRNVNRTGDRVPNHNLDLNLNLKSAWEIKSKSRIKIKNPLARGFTMVEIAISLAVIAFALVAIIGVMPLGIGVQRENKEDTLVNLDGQYLLEAIQKNTEQLNFLTNFVESITIESTDAGGTTIERYFDGYTFPNIQSPPGVNTNDYIRSAREIIGLLTTPKFTSGQTNKVTAVIHSLNGAAVEQGTSSPDVSFTYQATVEVVPHAFFAPGSASSVNDTNSAEAQARFRRYMELTNLCRNVSGDTNYFGDIFDVRANLFDVRLTLRWPVKPDGTTVQRPRRQEFRAIASAALTNAPGLPANGLWFFQPQLLLKP